MINRNWDHGDGAIRIIKQDFGAYAPIEWIHCDLGDLEEVRKVFSTIRDKEERIDIVCLLSLFSNIWDSSLIRSTVSTRRWDQCEQGKSYLISLWSCLTLLQFGLDHDMIDRHFGVNWLGHFYAMNVLYPLMRRTSKLPSAPTPRIVMLSSELHRAAPSSVRFESLGNIFSLSIWAHVHKSNF